MVKYMSYKNDITEIKIEELTKKTRINTLEIYLYYIPSIMSVIILELTDMYFLNILTTIFLIYAFYKTNAYFKNISKTKALIKVLRANKMHIDGHYEDRMKILGAYNPKYSYDSLALVKVAVYGSISAVFWASYVGRVIILFVFLMIVLSSCFYDLYLSKTKRFQKRIIKVFQPNLINVTSLKPLFESKLYPYMYGTASSYLPYKNAMYYVYGDKKFTIYCHTPFYDMTDYKMYVYYTIASGVVKRKISPIYKRENTMLFVFKKPEFLYKIKVKNLEISSKYDESLENKYEVTVYDYYLFPEIKKVLDEIYERDVVDIYCDNGYIYIKKYITSDNYITEQDLLTYKQNVELYKKFIDTLK